ncbi:hypothetical protein ACCO45_007877 [Purpureocillium lilacinum]|uniref:Uncharacterized protein n=1 Tax=Purpureocillium lilacinum TaxID=33203 RepID=A0ACC4DP57_PURLI
MPHTVTSSLRIKKHPVKPLRAAFQPAYFHSHAMAAKSLYICSPAAIPPHLPLAPSLLDTLPAWTVLPRFLLPIFDAAEASVAQAAYEDLVLLRLFGGNLGRKCPESVAARVGRELFSRAAILALRRSPWVGNGEASVDRSKCSESACLRCVLGASSRAIQFLPDIVRVGL